MTHEPVSRSEFLNAYQDEDDALVVHDSHSYIEALESGEWIAAYESRDLTEWQ